MLRRQMMLGGIGFVLAGRGWAQGALREITIPVSSFSFASGAIRSAQALGLFAKNGLNARVIAMDSANAATSALIGGSAEVVASGSGELIAAQARGQKVIVVADAYRGLSASLVLSKAAIAKLGVTPDAPLAQRLKALDGLVIASPSATSAYTVSFKGGADSVGAKPRFTYMAQPAMPGALETGAIQGMIAGAPFWGVPVSKGSGALWLSGPRGELPPANLPVSTIALQVMQGFAEANPQVMAQLAATMRDLSQLVVAQPEVVKAAIIKLYPDVDAATMEVLFAAEAISWNTKPLTVADMQHEIEFVRSGGTPIPGIEKLDPGKLLYKPPA